MGLILGNQEVQRVFQPADFEDEEYELLLQAGVDPPTAATVWSEANCLYGGRREVLLQGNSLHPVRQLVTVDQYYALRSR